MIGGGLALLVLLLIGIGYYSTYIGPSRETAIRVGNHDISLGEYRDRLRAATLASDPNATQADAFNKESSTTELLETEQIYLRRAQTLGISANDDAIAVTMATGVHVPTKDNQIVDIATYETILRNELQRLGLSLDQERNAARASVLKNNVLQKFRADVPKQAFAVKATELVFASRQQGQAAQQRLGNGDSVSDIAQAVGELHRVLRPGGELRFNEHVVSDKPVWRVLQRTAGATLLTARPPLAVAPSRTVTVKPRASAICDATVRFQTSS